MKSGAFTLVLVSLAVVGCGKATSDEDAPGSDAGSDGATDAGIDATIPACEVPSSANFADDAGGACLAWDAGCFDTYCCDAGWFVLSCLIAPYPAALNCKNPGPFPGPEPATLYCCACQ